MVIDQMKSAQKRKLALLASVAGVILLGSKENILQTGGELTEDSEAKQMNLSS